MKIRTAKVWGVVFKDGSISEMTAMHKEYFCTPSRVRIIRESDWRKIVKHLKKYPMEESK